MAVEVKICGLTRPEDAALAAVSGAWRLGVIFAWGPRLIDATRAREIVAAASGTPVIGVFGDQSAPQIIDQVRESGIAGAQLHRPASMAEIAVLQEAGLEVWQVWHLQGAPDGVIRLPQEHAAADVVLLEPGRPGSGGSGHPLALPVAREARIALVGQRVALAGGLTPGNVAEAIRFVRPDVVDVSSGVEMAPGIKDPDRLRRFLENARDTGSAA